MPPKRKRESAVAAGRRKRRSTTILFKSNHTKNGRFLLSNFYGNAEIDYMLPKFVETPAVFEMVERWKQIHTVEELNRWRHDLTRKRVVVKPDGTRALEPKGGKSGAPYTAKQERSYLREHNGAAFLGTGVLAKLAANSWKDPGRMRVVEYLAGMLHESMSPPLNLYERTTAGGKRRRKDSMTQALRNKFSREPYRSYLLDTGSAELGEQSKDEDFGFDGKNLLGKWLMELREQL